MQEIITIEGGLGPIQASSSPLSLEISPLTVFIGPQGTGKSLVSQLLYFFRNTKYLFYNYFNQEEPQKTVREVLDGIRAGELTNRALASFLTTDRVSVQYQREQIERQTNFYKINRQINAGGSFRNEVDQWSRELAENPLLAGKITPNALFIPAERTFFSRFINAEPTIFGNASLAITMQEFAKILLSKVAEIHILWENDPEQKPPQAQEIDNLITASLGGRVASARRGPYARKWQWIPKNSEQELEIEMASSGQMGSWPLIATAQALFAWPKLERPLFIHIEEPETHLHPAAQVAIVKVIAYLVNQGFHLVVTTHSIVVLYLLNNLTLAEQQLGNKAVENFPETQARISPKNISAYLFNNGEVSNIVDNSGQIDEGLLSSVLGDLEVEFNHLQTYGLWE